MNNHHRYYNIDTTKYQTSKPKPKDSVVRALIIIWIILMSIAMTILFSIGIFQLFSMDCRSKTVAFEYSNYKFYGGCMVKHKGIMIPLENIKVDY